MFKITIFCHSERRSLDESLNIKDGISRNARNDNKIYQNDRRKNGMTLRVEMALSNV